MQDGETYRKAEKTEEAESCHPPNLLQQQHERARKHMFPQKGAGNGGKHIVDTVAPALVCRCRNGIDTIFG